MSCDHVCKSKRRSEQNCVEMGFCAAEHVFDYEML